MTKYISNIVRIFKTDVGDPQQLLIDEFNGMPPDAPGILTFTLSAPNPGGPVSFTSRVFDDPSGLDKYMAAVQNSSDERKKHVADINAKCVSVRFRIVRVIKEGKYVGANPPAIMVRNFIRPKRGYLDEVTSMLTSTIENAPDDRTSPTLTLSTTGQQGLLTLSGLNESLAAAEETYERFQSAQGEPARKRMSDITEGSVRVPFFILGNTIEM